MEKLYLEERQKFPPERRFDETEAKDQFQRTSEVSIILYISAYKQTMYTANPEFYPTQKDLMIYYIIIYLVGIHVY